MSSFALVPSSGAPTIIVYMEYVAGIDQSLQSTGICVLSLDGSLVYLDRIIPPPGYRDLQRLVYIRNTLSEVFSKYSILAATMEGYSINSINKKFALGELGGIIKLLVWDHGAKLYVAAPKQLKKFATGTGSADKDAVKKAVKATWGPEIENDDEADAYVLAQISLEILQSKSRKRYQLDTVRLIKQP